MIRHSLQIGLVVALLALGSAGLWLGLRDSPAYPICEGQLDRPQQSPSACD
jgi:hypothetical protein